MRIVCGVILMELPNILSGQNVSKSNIEVSCFFCCEAQGKGRAKGRLRKVTQRSFIDYRWWMVDILSLMLYTKFG